MISPFAQLKAAEANVRGTAPLKAALKPMRSAEKAKERAFRLVKLS
jgi:hypothetical protein